MSSNPDPYTRIYNNTFTDCLYAIYASTGGDSDNLTITNNTFQRLNSTLLNANGIFVGELNTHTDINISDNYFYNLGTCVWMGYCDRVTIANNFINASNASIRKMDLGSTGYVRNFLIVNNTILNSPGTGIYSGSPITNFTIENNTFYRINTTIGSGYAIELYTVNGTYIARNNFTLVVRALYAGNAFTQSTNLTVVNNTVLNTTGAGAFYATNFNFSVFEDNTLTNCSGGGYYFTTAQGVNVSDSSMANAI
jgi:hypothetical protein